MAEAGAEEAADCRRPPFSCPCPFLSPCPRRHRPRAEAEAEADPRARNSPRCGGRRLSLRARTQARGEHFRHRPRLAPGRAARRPPARHRRRRLRRADARSRRCGRRAPKRPHCRSAGPDRAARRRRRSLQGQRERATDREPGVRPVLREGSVHVSQPVCARQGTGPAETERVSRRSRSSDRRPEGRRRAADPPSLD